VELQTHGEFPRRKNLVPLEHCCRCPVEHFERDQLFVILFMGLYHPGFRIVPVRGLAAAARVGWARHKPRVFITCRGPCGRCSRVALVSVFKFDRELLILRSSERDFDRLNLELQFPRVDGTKSREGAVKCGR